MSFSLEYKFTNYILHHPFHFVTCQSRQNRHNLTKFSSFSAIFPHNLPHSDFPLQYKSPGTRRGFTPFLIPFPHQFHSSPPFPFYLLPSTIAFTAFSTNTAVPLPPDLSMPMVKSPPPAYISARLNRISSVQV